MKCTYPVTGESGMLWKAILDQFGTLLQPVLKKIIEAALKNLVDQLSRNLPAGTQMSTFVDVDKATEDTMKELLS